MLSTTFACATGQSLPEPLDPGLLSEPSHPAFSEVAPDTFRVRFETTAGAFTVEAVREWAPHGTDRFFNLVRAGFYDGVRFFRVVEGFVAQFGLHPDPDLIAAWRDQRIPDDSVVASNVRGTVTFAAGGPDTRTTQLFVNLGDNSGLDPDGFAPFARVVEGIEVVDELHDGYGDSPPGGDGPAQQMIHREGEAYLEREFPLLDRIVTARIVGTGPGSGPTDGSEPTTTGEPDR